MIEKPDIKDKTIISALLEYYSLPVTKVEFLPLGLDSSAWSYRAKTENAAYFLKIRKEIPNPAGILIPLFLKERGIEQVMAPLLSNKGKAWEKGEDFYFILYPFIVSRRGMDVGMSDAHWIEFGSVLKQLHSMKLPAELLNQMKYETFVPRWFDCCSKIHAQVKACEYDDLYQKQLAEFWLENDATISVILERTEMLAKRMQETSLEFVLCHADIHTANLLLTDDDKIFIVDWDETMLAPKERDLLFLMGSIFGDRMEGKAEQLFFEGYGETEVDMLALAYYRYNWCIEDMGAFAEQIFATENIGEETKKSELSWFKFLFAPGNSIELALKTQIEI